MNVIINHVNGCRSFTIDTESDHCIYVIALIKGHSISARSQLFVLFTRLDHWTSLDLILFQDLFELGNTIMSWESPLSDLEKALNYQLFPFPFPWFIHSWSIEFKSSIEGHLLPCKMFVWWVLSLSLSSKSSSLCSQLYALVPSKFHLLFLQWILR
jgi:hypothetical protein